MIAPIHPRQTWPSTYFDLRSGLFIGTEQWGRP